MRNRAGLLLLHLFASVTFIALPILLAPSSESFSDTIRFAGTQRDFIAYTLMVLFFYLNYFYLIPRLYFHKKYVSFFVISFISLLVITYVPTLIITQHSMQLSPRPQPQPFRHEPSFFRFISRHLFIFLLVVFFSLVLKISNQWKRSEKERVDAELSYLKAQINPHFLFNTLNSIYSLAIEKSEHTASAIVKLSGMMRYVISDADHDFVSLEKEINYLRSYIELQQLRFSTSIHMNFMVKGSGTGKKIAPLILIPFVENAFKHGIHTEEESAITIRIDIFENNLHLQVKNKKVTAQHQHEDKSGLGIDNTKNRLQLLYPAAHTLLIDDQKDYFMVSLKLELI